MRSADAIQVDNQSNLNAKAKVDQSVQILRDAYNFAATQRRLGPQKPTAPVAQGAACKDPGPTTLDDQVNRLGNHIFFTTSVYALLGH